ncbi:MAG: hypothetical protein ABTQ31_06855 [Rhizobiaceae bacterium]
MDTLIIQDTFEPYCAGKDEESDRAAPKPGKRWLALRGKESRIEKDRSTDSRTGA